MVPANKKRAAMHSLYSLDINTRQRARNQPRLHRQLLPNDTDTHTQPLIVIKQKEAKAGREKEKERRNRGESEQARERERERRRDREGRRGAQAAARRCCEFVHAPIRALRVVDECGRLRILPSLSLSRSISFSKTRPNIASSDKYRRPRTARLHQP